MTVKELIDLLSQMPLDATVIHTMMSDYSDIEPQDINLLTPKDGEGVIRHHGHLMFLRKKWWPSDREWPQNSEFITAVHFKGN